MTDLYVDPALLRPPSDLYGLPERARAALMSAGRRRRFPARARIVRCDRVGGLYLLLSGRARMSLEQSDGRAVALGALECGDFFGDLDAADGVEHALVVSAVEPCELLHVPRSEFVELLREQPEAAVTLMNALARRLRRAYGTIASLAFCDVRHRLGHMLLELARARDGQWVVDTGSEELARMLGASREMVSRVLKRMIDEGLIRRERRRTYLLDRERLAA